MWRRYRYDGRTGSAWISVHRGENVSVSTRELWAKLFKSPTIYSYLEEHSGASLPSFSDYISQLADERNLKRETVIQRSGLERTFGHKLFNGSRNPSRDTVLQMAFGLGLTCDETQQLLKVAQMSALHPKVKRDAVIAYCLHNASSFLDVQDMLFANALPLLGGAKRD